MLNITTRAFCCLALLFVHGITIASELTALTEKQSIQAQSIIYENLDMHSKAIEQYEMLGEDTLSNDPELAFRKASNHCKKIESSSFLTIPIEASNCLNQLKENHSRHPNHLPTLIALFHYRLKAPGIAGGSDSKAEQLLNLIKKLSLSNYKELKLALLSGKDERDELVKFATQGVNQEGDHNFLYLSCITLLNEGHHDLAYDGLKKLLHLDIDSYYYLAALYQIGKRSAEFAVDLQVGWDALNQFMRADKPDSRLPSDMWAAFRMSQILKASGYGDSAKKIVDQLRARSSLDPNLMNRLDD